MGDAGRRGSRPSLAAKRTDQAAHQSFWLRAGGPAKTDAADTLDRYADPEETSRAVAFLVSDPGPFVSGQVLRVDGGAQLWPS